jgi:hypothetical protein
VNPKQYPRLRIRKLPYETGDLAWTVLVKIGPARTVSHVRCDSYEQARLLAAEIWANYTWLRAR